MSSTNPNPQISTDWSARFATGAYRFRWLLSAMSLAACVAVLALGGQRVSKFSEGVASLSDTSNGTGAVKPLAFDPSMDIWFGEQDSAVNTYYEIEKRFVAEDYVMITFEETEHEFGIFSPDALSTIARLTERFLTVPGVRHVRSLTYNPWIRWGTIEDDEGSEDGLIISDLVEGDPNQLTEAQIIERMVAVLGAERVAQRLGEGRVREVLGAGADFSQHIGEPLLLGTIVSDTGTTTAIQIQVLRPRVDEEKIAETFSDEGERATAPTLFSVESQRSALRGIDHFLRIEKGLAIPTPDGLELQEAIAALPEGEEKEARLREFRDPNKNFMKDASGNLLRKFFEYDPTPDGYVDSSEPSDVVVAKADFAPKELSKFEFRVGGVPFFERNFENVGLADAFFLPLMFVVIAVVLFVVFRNVVGVALPLLVVFSSIAAMWGIAFLLGDLLNNLTMMTPNMLTAVGVADAIHLVAAWVILRGRYETKRDLIVEVVRLNALPVFLTSVTTAVGFYSLTVSKLVPVQMLGSMVAIGTFVAWAVSMTLVPAILSLVPHRPGKIKQRTSRVAALFTEERSSRFVDLVQRWRVGIVGTALVLTVIAIYGLTRIEIDSDFRAMFPDDNPVMSDFRWIEDRMGGVGDLEIVFRGLDIENAPELTVEEEDRRVALGLRVAGVKQEPDEFEALSTDEATELAGLEAKYQTWNATRVGVNTAFLASLEKFERRMREEMADPNSDLGVITDFLSPLDTLRKIHQVQNENRAAFYRVPGEADVPDELRKPELSFDEFTEEWSLVPGQSGSSLAAQYYLQYESGARPGESLTTQLSADRTQFRVQGRVLQESSMRHLRAFGRIEQIANEEFPELAVSAVKSDTKSPEAGGQADGVSSLTISGKSLLFARTSQLFATGFVQSMAIALSAITVLIAVIFRSVSIALLSLIPNVLPIVLPLSVFGLIGLPLDGPAILVSSVALGVCVDDTIHFLTKFVRSRRKGKNRRDSLIHVFSEAGAAMTVTTIVLIIGFATLLLSDFAPNYQMGALAAVMIALAWVADFVVTAAVLSFGGESKTNEPETSVVDSGAEAATV
ncbi:MAG: MMPL family transporter [Planctomycetota bacterium]